MVNIPNFLAAIDDSYDGKFTDELKTLVTPLHDKKEALKSVVSTALELPGTQTLSDEEQASLLRAGFEFAIKLIHQLAKQPGRAELLEV